MEFRQRVWSEWLNNKHNCRCHIAEVIPQEMETGKRNCTAICKSFISDFRSKYYDPDDPDEEASDEEEKEEIYKCIECDKIYKHKISYQCHMQRYHSANIPDYCKVKFACSILFIQYAYSNLQNRNCPTDVSLLLYFLLPFFLLPLPLFPPPPRCLKNRSSEYYSAIRKSISFALFAAKSASASTDSRSISRQFTNRKSAQNATFAGRSSPKKSRRRFEIFSKLPGIMCITHCVTSPFGLRTTMRPNWTF